MSGGRLPDLVSGEKSFPLGATVTVTVDRPLGSLHPDYPSLRYPVNYGFIAGIMAPDGEEQDAYILGVSTPCRTFTGKVIAIVRRRDDVGGQMGGGSAPSVPLPGGDLAADRVSGALV